MMLLALFVEELALRATEDVADFDAATDLGLPFAVRRGSPASRRCLVGHFGFGEVAADVDAGEVVVVFVGAGDEISHRRDAAIHHHAAGKAHRAQLSRRLAPKGSGMAGEAAKVSGFLTLASFWALDRRWVRGRRAAAAAPAGAGGFVAIDNDGLDVAVAGTLRKAAEARRWS